MIQRFMCVAKVIVAVLCFCCVVWGCRSSSRSVVAQLGPVGGDMDSHGCRASAGYVWCEVLQDCIRVFERGVRAESADGNAGAAYLVFSADSSQVELFFSNGESSEILDRRVLPTGASVWNVEDDDAKNIRRVGGVWIVERRGKPIYRESILIADESLGCVQERVYEGEFMKDDGSTARCILTMRNREHSGDGTFVLECQIFPIDAKQEEPVIYSGRFFTLRGDADDMNAVVWQLVADDGPVFHFCCSDNGERLMELNDRLERTGPQQFLRLVRQKGQ